MEFNEWRKNERERENDQTKFCCLYHVRIKIINLLSSAQVCFDSVSLHWWRLALVKQSSIIELDHILQLETATTSSSPGQWMNPFVGNQQRNVCSSSCVVRSFSGYHFLKSGCIKSGYREPEGWLWKLVSPWFPLQSPWDFLCNIELLDHWIV